MAFHYKFRSYGKPIAECRADGCDWTYRGNSQVTSALATVNRNAAKHADETGHSVEVRRAQWKLVEPDRG